MQKISLLLSEFENFSKIFSFTLNSVINYKHFDVNDKRKNQNRQRQYALLVILKSQQKKQVRKITCTLRLSTR